MGEVVLAAKTRKAKSRIKKWGTKWEILRGNENSWMIVSYQDDTMDNQSIRWINKVCDPDFEIVDLIED